MEEYKLELLEYAKKYDHKYYFDDDANKAYYNSLMNSEEEIDNN
jgi:hypothetical protein